MSQRWTSKEHDTFKRRWLLERMGHAWSTDAPCRCTACGAKYGPRSVQRICPKRRKPNRWRLHYRRAVTHAQYPPDPPVKRTASWILEQLAKIAWEVKRDPRFEDDRYWKYHRLARRYRRLMRDWWTLPKVPIIPSPEPDRFAGVLTTRCNKLLRQAQQTQARVIDDHGCRYTFHAHAMWKGQPLFTDEEIP